MGWVAAAKSQKNLNRQNFTRIFSASVAEIGSSSVARACPRRETSAPSLVATCTCTGSLYSGALALINTAATSFYFGACLSFKDSSFRARRAHDECRLSAEAATDPAARINSFPSPAAKECAPPLPSSLSIYSLGYRKVTPQAALSHSHTALWWLQLNVRMVDNN